MITIYVAFHITPYKDLGFLNSSSLAHIDAIIMQRFLYCSDVQKRHAPISIQIYPYMYVYIDI